MTDWIFPLAALLTIAFGAFGFLAPRFTAAALDLTPGDSTMGLSEIRASVGGLFVVMGLGCLIIGTPEAYGMLGLAYVGAASGRFLSCFLDRPTPKRAWIFGLIEAALAAMLTPGLAV